MGWLGSLYLPTEAGLALEPVLNALGVWGEMWMEVRPTHTEPGLILWSWIRWGRKLSVPEIAARPFPAVWTSKPW